MTVWGGGMLLFGWTQALTFLCFERVWAIGLDGNIILETVEEAIDVFLQNGFQ